MPCFNRSYDLLNTLKAYDRQITTEPFELIAVDDASSDGTYQVLTTYKPLHYSLVTKRLNRNQGPAAARNFGLALVDSPLVLFVGDDILPDTNFINAHLMAHKEYPEKEIAILGHIDSPDDMPINTLMKHINGIGAQQFSYYYFKNAQEYDFRHLYTANISLKMEMLNTLDHWFDTDFPHAAFEDVELSYRLVKKGLRILYLTTPIVKHYHYHTALSFTERQYKSGMMAHLLSKKHLGVAWFFRGQYLKIISVCLNTIIKRFLKGCSNRIETIALRLANQYEWENHHMLDSFYLGLLDYYYYKGLIDGFFGMFFPSRWIDEIHNVHAWMDLSPVLGLLESKSEFDTQFNRSIKSTLKKSWCLDDKSRI